MNNPENEEEINPIKEKKDMHLLRKLFHMIPGLSLVYVIQSKLYPIYLLTVFLGLCFIISVLVEAIRIKYKSVNDLTIGLSKYIIRKEELKEFSGVPFYIGGCFIVLLAFNRDIASLSILYLALGDPFSSIMGIGWGQDSFKFKNGKSIVGMIGGITICMIITMIYGTFKGWDINSLYAISLFGGLAGGLSETFALDEINDNIFIPLVSALILSIVFSNYFMPQ